VRRRRPAELLLLLFSAVFLVGICASTRHWQRWAIEILPVLVLFAGSTVDVVTSRLITLARHVRRAWILKPAALVAITGVLAIHPVAELAAINRRDSRPSTSGAALDWVVTNIAPGSRLLVDPSTLIARNHTRLQVDDRFSPRTDTLAGYREARYDYLIVNGLRAGRYRLQARLYPRETAFYRDIACHARLVAVFRTTKTQRGAAVRVYRLDEPPSKRASIFCGPQTATEAAGAIAR
jgi:hypothetical protein